MRRQLLGQGPRKGGYALRSQHELRHQRKRRNGDVRLTMQLGRPNPPRVQCFDPPRCPAHDHVVRCKVLVRRKRHLGRWVPGSQQARELDAVQGLARVPWRHPLLRRQHHVNLTPGSCSARWSATARMSNWSPGASRAAVRRACDSSTEAPNSEATTATVRSICETAASGRRLVTACA
jgi:hypothetical protein